MVVTRCKLLGISSQALRCNNSESGSFLFEKESTELKNDYVNYQSRGDGSVFYGDDSTLRQIKIAQNLLTICKASCKYACSSNARKICFRNYFLNEYWTLSKDSGRNPPAYETGIYTSICLKILFSNKESNSNIKKYFIPNHKDIYSVGILRFA
jgi:hypothetical protein